MSRILAVVVAVILTIAVGGATLATPVDPVPTAAPSACEDRCMDAYEGAVAQADASYSACTSYGYVCYAAWLFDVAAARLTHSDCIDTCYYLPQISGAPRP